MRMHNVLMRLLAGLALVASAAAWGHPCFHQGAPVFCPNFPTGHAMAGQPIPDTSETTFTSGNLTRWRLPNGTFIFIEGTMHTAFFPPVMATPPSAPVVPPSVAPFGPALPSAARDVLALTRGGASIVEDPLNRTRDNLIDMIALNQGSGNVSTNVASSGAGWQALTTADGSVRLVFDAPVSVLESADFEPTFLFRQNLADPDAAATRQRPEPSGTNAAEIRDFVLEDGLAMVFSRDGVGVPVEEHDSTAADGIRFRVPLLDPQGTSSNLDASGLGTSDSVEVTLLIFAVDAEGNVFQDEITLPVDSPSVQKDPVTGSVTVEYSPSTSVNVPTEILAPFLEPAAKPAPSKLAAPAELKRQQEAARIERDLNSTDPVKKERGKIALESASAEVKNLVATNVVGKHVSKAETATDAGNSERLRIKGRQLIDGHITFDGGATDDPIVKGKAGDKSKLQED